jgi:hypothetical protein
MNNGRMHRHNAGVGQRMRSIRDMTRQNLRPNLGPGVECTGTPLGERLGIAAIYAGRGEQSTGVAAALLAIAGVEDSAASRASVLASLDHIAGVVRLAANSGEVRHAH